MARPKLFNPLIGVKLQPELDGRVRAAAVNAGIGLSELVRISLASIWGDGTKQEQAARRLKELGGELPQAATA